MSLINTYLKKAALRQEKKEQPAEVPPFLLQEESVNEKDRSLALMIAVLFVLLVLLTVSGYMFFFRESGESSPFTQIKPPKAPASFDRHRAPAGSARLRADREQGDGQSAASADQRATTGIEPVEKTRRAVPRIYAVEGPVVDTVAEDSGPSATGTEGNKETSGQETAAGKPQQQARQQQEQEQELKISSTHQNRQENGAAPEADNTGSWPLPLETEHIPPVETAVAQPQDGRELFREARNEASYLYQIGLQAQKNGDLGRAERYYRLVLRQKADHLNTLINLSAVYIKEGRFDDARSLLDRIDRLEAGNVKATVNRGLIAMYTGKTGQAVELFKRALQRDPTEETALVNLAYLAQQMGKVTEAENYFHRLLKIAPDNREALLAYANLEENNGRYDKAIALYSRCLDQLSMQKDQALYSRIRNRINLLRQYLIQESYKRFYSENEQSD